MIRRILGRRRPTLTGIALEEELVLLRVELMYGLRVSREAYLRRKLEEREEVGRLLRGRAPEELLAGLRGCLDRVARPRPAVAATDQGFAGESATGSTGQVVELSRRRVRRLEEPGTA